MEVDPTGDYFGDYSEDDLFSHTVEQVCDHADEVNDEQEVEFLEEWQAEEEIGLEPARTLQPSQGCDETEVDGEEASQTHHACRIRGGAEEPLRRQPFVEKYRTGKAGAVVSREGPDANSAYASSLTNKDNLFSPFSSKLEWEIARWAKLRGPSSTAFTELMGIDGVRSFLGATKL